jgi:NAD(P) transhydrogenase subunit alpha
MEIAVPRERHPRERRVALAPSHIPELEKLGFHVRVEGGAGLAAGWSDEEYGAAGARVEADRAAVLAGAGCVVKVRPPSRNGATDGDEVALLPEGALLLSFLSPGADPDVVERLAARGLSVIAMERMPRTTKAQRMDALSSQATAAGYHAALLAATHLPRFFPMLTTAAGTVRPARVTVLGAGVAGLQAIATARRLGASVQGYDIRAAAAEQVRSLGASFLSEEDEALPEGAEEEGGYARALDTSEADRQLAFLARHLPKSDAIITTAQIPGRPAPLLVTREVVDGMRGGSVVVDLAAETGGNCELSVAGETLVHSGVTILAPTDLPSGVAQHASEMYGTNLVALLKHIAVEGRIELDLEDDIVTAVLVAHAGSVRISKGGS